MGIFIEIGSEEQKELILEELSIIQAVADEHPIRLGGIWVPEDFDKKVNELQKTTNYTSERGQQAIAKNVIAFDGEIHLVFSKLLYTSNYNSEIRMHFYLHELVHAVNNKSFPSLSKFSQAEKIYYKNLYILFDEYWANRQSLQLVKKIFKEPSILFKNFLKCSIKWHLLDAIDNKHYENVRNEISSFGKHQQIDIFLESTSQSFDEVSKSIIYFHSYLDENPFYYRYENFLKRTKFYNDHTCNLIKFIRKKFDTRDVDLRDGLNFIQGYLRNFGLHFEDCPQGVWVNVVDC